MNYTLALINFYFAEKIGEKGKGPLVFSNLVFLFVFLPIVLFFYYIVDPRFKNLCLLFASLIFYAWGEPKLVVLMMFSIMLNYVFGLLIEKSGTRTLSVFWLTAGLVVDLAILFYYKYINFFIDNINQLFGLSIAMEEVTLPIGISFYTFQAMSYLIDVYRKDVKAQTSILDLALYIALFPQLVAGPIVRYQTIALELKQRVVDSVAIMEGIKIFIIGLAKKVLIANQLAVVADYVFNKNISETSVTLLWIGIIAYSLQIYFDFSGYSQMAIGLGRMFGFHFPENFNFPYISASITEFWRRWHMTLSGWFRDYVYIPLGGNRVPTYRVYMNLFIVWMLTGFWHGASWTFIAWGIYYGIIIMLEKAFLGKWLSNWWRPIRHVYVVLLFMIGWVFFRADSFPYSIAFVQGMFGFQGIALWSLEAKRILHDNWLVLAAGIVFSMPTFDWLRERFFYRREFSVIGSFGYLFVLMICIMMLVNSTYNPFIYFRF